MKNLLLLLTLVACSASLQAQATASTNQTITTQGVDQLELNLFSPDVEIRETKGSRLIVESHITIEGLSNSALLDYVIKAGRYDLETKSDASTQTLTLTRKTDVRVLMSKGQECTERVRYIVLVPSAIKNVKTNTAQGPVE